MAGPLCQQGCATRKDKATSQYAEINSLKPKLVYKAHQKKHELAQEKTS